MNILLGVTTRLSDFFLMVCDKDIANYDNNNNNTIYKEHGNIDDLICLYKMQLHASLTVFCQPDKRKRR